MTDSRPVGRRTLGVSKRLVSGERRVSPSWSKLVGGSDMRSAAPWQLHLCVLKVARRPPAESRPKRLKDVEVEAEAVLSAGVEVK